MPPSVELVCVDPDEVAKFWPHTRDLIKAAIDHTGLSDFDAVECDVLRGDQLLWLAWNGTAIEAAATTKPIKIGARKICVIVACSGHHRERWLPLSEKIEAYAKAEGCEAIRLYGRKGWERVLSDYRVEHVIMEKVI